jgi:hypothetical protein
MKRSGRCGWPGRSEGDRRRRRWLWSRMTPTARASYQRRRRRSRLQPLSKPLPFPPQIRYCHVIFVVVEWSKVKGDDGGLSWRHNARWRWPRSSWRGTCRPTFCSPGTPRAGRSTSPDSRCVPSLVCFCVRRGRVACAVGVCGSAWRSVRALRGAWLSTSYARVCVCGRSWCPDLLSTWASLQRKPPTLFDVRNRI